MPRALSTKKRICEAGKEKGKRLISEGHRRPVQRPNAAIKERERLKKFNEHLEALQNVIPIHLPEGRKLHKKQTLQMACRYIRFLQDCLSGTKDWSDRRRFWCGTDEDHSMIQAIDAAELGAKALASKESKEKVELNFRASGETKTASFEKTRVTKNPHDILENQKPCTTTGFSGMLYKQTCDIAPASVLASEILPDFNQQFPTNPHSLHPNTNTQQSHCSFENLKTCPKRRSFPASSNSNGTGTATQSSKPLTPQSSPVGTFSVPLYSDEEHLDDVWTDINEVISQNEPTNLME